MYNYVVTWALLQIISVNAPGDPYTGAVPQNQLKQSTIQIMYKSFQTEREAKYFMDHAPAYIHNHMHLDDMSPPALPAPPVAKKDGPIETVQKFFQGKK